MGGRGVPLAWWAKSHGGRFLLLFSLRAPSPGPGTVRNGAGRHAVRGGRRPDAGGGVWPRREQQSRRRACGASRAGDGLQ
eukprot:9473663-Pyramimonas_sp.AAC.1